jgi:hypothetical protein
VPSTIRSHCLMELHSLRDKGPLKLIKVKNRKHPAMERVPV